MRKIFLGLCVPVIGEDAAQGLFFSWQDRTRAVPDYPALGMIAAFVRGEFDDANMKLDQPYWEDIVAALGEASQEMDMDSLTELWGNLLARGLLK